jgi:hypothetical protein
MTPGADKEANISQPEQPVTTGIHTMKDLAYHSDPCPEPSLSSSIVKVLLSHSPLHASEKHSRLNPHYIPDESARFDLGSTVHAVLLERDWSAIRVIDPMDHVGKKGAAPAGWTNNSIRAARDDARAQGLIPILKDQAETVQDMVIEAMAFLDRSEVNGILENGSPEQTLVWNESVDGVKIWLRARLDWLRHDYELVLDYKTCQNASPQAFQRQILAMGYDIQAAFYLRALGNVIGVEGARFVFFAQEIEPPYACSLHQLSPAFIDMAADKVQRGIELWAESMRSGVWPSYPNCVCRVDPPAWALNQYMESMERADS